MRLPTIALGALALSAISFTALSSPVDVGEISNNEAAAGKRVVNIDKISKDEAAAASAAGSRVGVVFTDVMPNDRIFVHNELIRGDLDKFIVVISGVKETEKAYGVLHDFLSKKDFSPPRENVIFVKGDRLTVEKPHEHDFVGEPKNLDITFEDLIEKSDFIKKDDYLLVTQMALTPKEHIKKLAGKSRIQLFHLFPEKPGDDYHNHSSDDAAAAATTLHYCEDPASRDATTHSWLQEVESTIKQFSPDAYTLVTVPLRSYLHDQGRIQ